MFCLKKMEKSPAYPMIFHIGTKFECYLPDSKQLMTEILTFLRNAYDEEKMHAQIEAEIAE